MALHPVTQKIAELTGSEVVASRPLHGGCVADVSQMELQDGRKVVVKQGGEANLAIEGVMLAYFGSHSPIPCPAVLHADPTLLIMDFIENDGHVNGQVQRDLANLLAEQHKVTQKQFGLSFNTLIGGLDQPNHPTNSWVEFFRDHRLLYMADQATRYGRLPTTLFSRIETLAAKLADLLPSGDAPSLLHGDLWGGNILCHKGKIAGLVDPAIYYGDREIELAFGTLFGDLTPAFFDRYGQIFPIQPGFFEERRDLYNLYPLLVHVRLFGGSYVGSVDRILTRFGV
ncbi:fructosamine kinase family protein [Thalassospira lucentensis]|uniref:fructosamine kinase family protein n=1 Tax=Thalassospira lucentensis TaxID=168935 RepID=UPI0029438062|nr:fructosamine kinase family protein [Thalassospira lucentensis]WOI12777.1 fructosamine kinase family protein [Thalassospira lucentensis]